MSSEPTLAERQAARKAKFKARFKAAGKTRAETLSKVAERTAQRRGRGFDPLETVIKKATQPPPPPKPKTRSEKAAEILGCDPNARFGPTVPRGVSFFCPGQPLQYTSSSNLTTQKQFGSAINRNQKLLRDAGLGDLIPKSPTQIANAERAIKIARRKGQNVSALEASFCKQGYPSSVVSSSKCKNLGLQGFDVGF